MIGRLSGVLLEKNPPQLLVDCNGVGYEVNVPINVRIGNAESMLPFRIQQVISGNDASIVTDDGRRLYVGDEYRGMRLAAIAGNQLSFTGKRTLNIVW